jgi:type IX secretion system PorP/SprF family membrane protein
MTRILSIILFALSTGVFGQYSFLYRQYVLNQLALNPAYTGSREVFVLASMYRNQWTGLGKASPVTYTMSADAPVKGRNIALGFSGIHEKIGNTSNLDFNINYAYRISLRNAKLSLGLKASANVFTVHPPSLASPNDHAFYSENRTFVLPNFGVGIYYYDYNKYFVGFSVPNLMVFQNKYPDSEVQGADGFTLDSTLFKAYNFIGSAGYLFELNENYKMRLSAFGQYNLASGMDFDVNAMWLVKDIAWLGASFNTADILTFMTQWQVNPQVKVGYAYDYSWGLLNNLRGSHEIMLRYEFSYIIKAESPIF